MATNDSQFELVRTLVMKLPEVEEGTTYGVRSWKLRGKLLACPALHKSAEPNSLLVKISPPQRTVLLSAKPDTYYVTDHYQSSSVVLVRLSKIDRKSLQTLLNDAWQFLNEANPPTKSRKRK